MAIALSLRLRLRILLRGAMSTWQISLVTGVVNHGVVIVLQSGYHEVCRMQARMQLIIATVPGTWTLRAKI